MAKVTVNADAPIAEVKLNKNINLPRDRYTLRLKKRDAGISKGSGNPMVTNVWEIAAPDSIMIGGQKVIIAGTAFNQYLVTRVLNNGEKKTAAESTVGKHQEFADMYKKCGGPILATDTQQGEEWDDENPPLLPEGTLVEAICNTKEKVEMKADPAKPGQFIPIKNADGTDMKSKEHFIEQIVGKSTLVLNAPY